MDVIMLVYNADVGATAEALVQSNLPHTLVDLDILV